MINKSRKPEWILSWVAVFVVIFFIISSRRPDVIFNAQPWAEDGKIWMENIYNNGFWNSLLLPQNGYYQTISRLTYGVALLFGISKAAFIANVIAISIRCLFVMFLLSSRMSFIRIQYRVAAVVFFLLMPNLSEGYVNITNIHWYLSLYLMAIVLANDAENPSWKIHDFTLLFISSLSGPFIVFIAPCLIIKRLSQRGGIVKAVKDINAFDITMAICCAIQVIAILSSSDSSRSSAPLGASFSLLSSIISYRVVGGSFFPNDYIAAMAGMDSLNITIFILLALMIVFLFLCSGWRFKSASLFPVLMIGFALAKPMMSLDQPQWPTLLIPGGGERYFFITNFAFFCMILFITNHLDRTSNSYLLILMIVVIPFMLKGYSIPPMADVGYNSDVQKFSNIEVGSKMLIHINPPGWTMELIKK